MSCVRVHGGGGRNAHRHDDVAFQIPGFRREKREKDEKRAQPGRWDSITLILIERHRHRRSSRPRRPGSRRERDSGGHGQQITEAFYRQNSLTHVLGCAAKT